jgi:hypothetical protein
MPQEVCWKCKQRKPGVTLWGDDRLCHDCDEENERFPAVIHKKKTVKANDNSQPTQVATVAVTPETTLLGTTTAARNYQSIGQPQRKLRKYQTVIYGIQRRVGEASDNSSATSYAGRDFGSEIGSGLTVNETLAYISFYRNKSITEALRRTVLSSFVPANTTEAKKTLVQRFQSLLSACPLVSDRRNSSTRGVHEAEIDDIIGIFDVLDTRGALRGTTFVAANLEILPKFGPEEINLAAIVERQARTDAAIENISTAVQRLADADTATETTANHVSSHSVVHA